MPNVHKDFHGALSYGLQFTEERLGPDGMNGFLAGLAQTVYWPLVEALRRDGLAAWRAHWENIFALEQGDAVFQEEGEALVMTVRRCPALAHMREQGYAVADHFCEHTRIVNEAVGRAAGFAVSVDYDQAQGTCVQRFWREKAE